MKSAPGNTSENNETLMAYPVPRRFRKREEVTYRAVTVAAILLVLSGFCLF
jgi:hypothetical protein